VDGNPLQGTLLQRLHEFDELTLERVRTPRPQTLESHIKHLEEKENEADNICEMIQRNEKPLNVQFELE
jgi:hypothetical protein